ncbi:NnrU family protein [Caulobacter segnis]|uniref:NnrUfamily protein n=2 Tax=Caulobacter segnis TaxID=88688 RepID=D5VNM4_CAUST|nr:NnrU family protein [Caulobacter segnis]ADG12097.1 NnrUfamily protein [Caulobacter segnis ATCC 21756]AVQ03704.1 NnrU family protein [Caulobacter segnis]
MTILILGLVVFLGVHSVRIVAAPLRDGQIAANEKRWKGLYALIAGLGFVLIILGWIAARPTAPQVYDPPTWGRHAAMGLVWIAFVLLAGSNGPVGRIKATVRHPMLLGTIAWAGGHLLANGDQASVILFGAFLAWAILDLISALNRKEPAPVVTKPIADLIALVAGTVLYAVFVLGLHRLLFGVSPTG